MRLLAAMFLFGCAICLFLFKVGLLHCVPLRRTTLYLSFCLAITFSRSSRRANSSGMLMPSGMAALSAASAFFISSATSTFN